LFVFRELIDIFSGNHPLKAASDTFTAMAEQARDMFLEASAVYWGHPQTAAERTQLYERDVDLNKKQRAIRKRVVAQLAGIVPENVPYGLLLMSLVKDVERIGDYAKNLTELAQWCPDPLPEDENTAELKEITHAVETLARDAVAAYVAQNPDRARELILEGRSTAKRCDELVPRIARSDYNAASAVKMAVGVRFYKRVGGHLLNMLTSMVMPLHKLDYYDEGVLEG
jgi:phosphate uptake regulator